MKKNIFVMAMDDFNQSMLERLLGGDDMVFHSLLDMETAVDSIDYDIAQLLSRARRTLEDFPGTVDAIVGYWDFPTCSLLPILRREWNLPGPSLEAALRCEHKYWARTEEVRVATRKAMTCDTDTFYIHAQMDAWEGETRVLSRNWEEAIPRDLV